ncbi:MAG: hypothetical protein SFY69_06140 [Planctomycetota bacterium]|nr:hypothetical protein [Planctomycetota bacterium]
MSSDTTNTARAGGRATHDAPDASATRPAGEAADEAAGEAAGEDQGLTRDAAIARVEAQVGGLRAQLAAAREALDHAERRHAIELELLRADALDMETARLMTEATVAQMTEPDVAAAVAELRARKPFLFRGKRGGAPGGTPGAVLRAMRGAEGAAPAEEAQAAGRGDRAALLRYLRSRRA